MNNVRRRPTTLIHKRFNSLPFNVGFIAYSVDVGCPGQLKNPCHMISVVKNAYIVEEKQEEAYHTDEYEKVVTKPSVKEIPSLD